jgi:hypothetical protein
MGLALHNYTGGDPMWHRLQVLVTKTQLAWLKAESYTGGRSVGEIVRDLIERELLRRQKDSESGSCMKPSETDTR